MNTRRSSRNKLPSPMSTTTAGTTTPGTNVSPFFSNKTSVRSDTPATTDIDEDDVLPNVSQKRATRSSTGGNAKKRPAESDGDENSVDDAAEVMRPPLKRRTVSSQSSVYVEIPPLPKPDKGKGKFKAPAVSAAKKANNESKRKGLTRGKLSVEELDEGEILPESDDGLDYDEAASIEESDASGSEYEASDNESAFEDVEDDDTEEEVPIKSRKSTSPRKPLPMPMDWDELNFDEEAGEEADDVMLDEALRQSRETAWGGTSSAGPSSSKGRRAEAEKRAAAAERRLAQQADAFEDTIYDEALTELEASSDESEPLAAKGKGKGRGAAKKASFDTSKLKKMSVREMRKLQREERANRRRPYRKEEAEYAKQLGRKLTMAEKSSVALWKNHPELKDVWGDLAAAIPIIKPIKSPQPDGLKVTLLPFQRESLYWMRKQEEGPWSGGMLADEMGMGKTIQIISLFISDRRKPNLVVAPTVAIMQWRNEIQTHTDGMKVLVWHGSGRESDAAALKKYDVVLTTYAVLESCFRKQQSGFKRKGRIVKEESPLHQINWSRIVLDEAHNIKERSTNTAKAAFGLKSKYKWCLSGTPLQNRVGELYSLVRFLGGDPFSYYFCKRCDCKSLHWKFSDKKSCDDCHHSPMQHTCFWNNEILTPIQKNGMVGPGQNAFKKLKILLDRMMLRRTKIQRADDLGLPPRTVIVRRDYFSLEEKELYLSLFSDAKRQFTTYVDSGTILNNYSNIFSLLTRMRQMACHPDLVLRSKNNSKKFLIDEDGEATVCRLCNDIAEDAIQSKCRHIFDRECIKQYLSTASEAVPDCPVCHLPLTIDLEAPALELEENVSTARQGILGRLNLDTWRSSSKIEALVEELSNLRKQDATTKSLVFSQFVNFLDLIAFRLQKAGFNVCRLEGTMSPQARDATIQHFMNNVEVTVFLVSLKAGGVALNLTEASRVYLMDSWWNPAVEYQAMDRIHRLGQHRPVKAIKLVVEDSIEARIVQLQEKKSAMVDATLSTDDSAMGRLTPEDLGFLFRL